jgi:phosphate transport system substrate-binding protein
MKKILASILLILSVAILPAVPSFGQSTGSTLSGNLSISGAWALYPMVLKWAEEFQKIHPKVKIDVQAGGAGKGIADALAGLVDFGMVSRNVHQTELDKGAFPVAVTKDAVLPTISTANPFLAEILKRGIKQQEFVGLWITKTVTSWNELLGTSKKAEIHVFTRSDACGAAETWAAYLGKRQEDLTGIGIYGDPGVADAVRRDALSIGFNNVNFAYDAGTLKPIEGITICPIDLNGNGQIDPEEKLYDSRDTITKAIAENVYPSPPARELYVVMKGKPVKPVLVEFLKWVLTDGQKYVPETGYINLTKERLAEGLALLGAGKPAK